MAVADVRGARIAVVGARIASSGRRRAGRRTAIAVLGVAVVALLARIDDAVAAQGRALHRTVARARGRGRAEREVGVVLKFFPEGGVDTDEAAKAHRAVD